MAGRRGTTQGARARQRTNRGRGARVNASTMGGRTRGGATSPSVDGPAVRRSGARPGPPPIPARARPGPPPIPSAVQASLDREKLKNSAAGGGPAKAVSGKVTRMGRIGMAVGGAAFLGNAWGNRRRGASGHNQSLYR